MGYYRCPEEEALMITGGRTVGFIVAVWLSPSDALAEPYSFQNVPLGIDLESFRQIKPQTTTSTVSGEPMQETRAFCSGDKLPNLDIGFTIEEQDALNASAGEVVASSLAATILDMKTGAYCRPILETPKAGHIFISLKIRASHPAIASFASFSLQRIVAT